MHSFSTKRYVGIIFFDVIVTLIILSLINYNGFSVWTWTSTTTSLTQRIRNSPLYGTTRTLISDTNNDNNNNNILLNNKNNGIHFPTKNLSEDFLFGKEYYNIYHKNDTSNDNNNNKDNFNLKDGSTFILNLQIDNDPSNGWNINWKYLKSILSSNTNNLELNNLASPAEVTPLLNLNKINKNALISSIKWENFNYNGYCRPYFYPYISSVHFKRENGLQRVVNVLSDLRPQKDMKPRYTKDDEIVTLLNYQINNNNNKLRPWVYHIFDFYNTSNIEYNEKTNFLNVKHSVGRRNADDTQDNVKVELSNEYRSDSERVSYMRDLRTHYRYDSMVLTHNPKHDRYNLEIVVATNRPQADSWKLHYEKDIPCNNEIEGKKRWIGEWNETLGEFWHPTYEPIDNGMENNVYLCVFSNGITILSNKIRRANDVKYFNSHYIIECDITDYPEILNTLLDNKNSNINTNIGLTLFSLLYKENDKQLFNEYLISMNIQIPVCSIIEINRKKNGKIYNNSIEYNAKSSNQFHRITPHSVLAQTNTYKQSDAFSNNNNMNDSDMSMASLLSNVKVQGVKHNLAAMTMIHPGLRSGRMDTLVMQWIDYHLFQGFNHFYLYDHLMNRDESDIDMFDKALELYINAKIVTLFEWPHVVRAYEHRDYEVSAYNDGIRRFRYDTKWLTLFDVDEWMVVLPTYAKTDFDFDYDWSKTPNVATLMKQSNENFGSQVLLAYQAITNFYENEQLNNINNNNDNIDSKNFDFITFGKDSDMKQNGPFYNDKLGCDPQNSLNKFDSFFERQSCLVYSIDNEYLINKFFNKFKTNNTLMEYNKYKYDDFTIYDKLDVIRRGANEMDIVKTRKRLQNDHGKWLHEPESIVNLKNINNLFKNDNERKEFKQLLYFDYLNEDSWWLGFSITPKVLINPMLAYLGFQHDMNLYNTHALLDNEYFIENSNLRNKYIDSNEDLELYNQKVYHSVSEMLKERHSDESGNLIKDLLNDNWDPPTWSEVNNNEENFLGAKYKIGLVHTTDHWRTLGFYYRANKFIDFKSKEDVSIFYDVIHSKCPSQGELMYINDKFLESRFGKNWKNKRKIPPLFDQFGRFCYDVNETYSQIWVDENGR